MKVFHLFSNHKYTGPADPALVTAAALQAEGVDVTLFAGRNPRTAGDGTDPQEADREDANGVRARAACRGIRVDRRLSLLKHGKPIALLRDIRALRSILRDARPDVVHTHLPNDHLIASVAARGSIPVVRTIYDAEVPRGFRARTAM
ncbi:MAG: glycosyltransferase, partial [Planctomycetes bacterium]|nr:glycosyltransferase [Planctomycetota bacterium]